MSKQTEFPFGWNVWKDNEAHERELNKVLDELEKQIPPDPEPTDAPEGYGWGV